MITTPGFYTSRVYPFRHSFTEEINKMLCLCRNKQIAETPCLLREVNRNTRKGECSPSPCPTLHPPLLHPKMDLLVTEAIEGVVNEY
jgi:hypothetical protein